jgi:hypothetical protein
VTQEVLTCYDGSKEAGRAIDAATHARRSVLIVPPVTT